MAQKISPLGLRLEKPSIPFEIMCTRFLNRPLLGANYLTIDSVSYQCSCPPVGRGRGYRRDSARHPCGHPPYSMRHSYAHDCDTDPNRTEAAGLTFSPRQKTPPQGKKAVAARPDKPRSTPRRDNRHRSGGKHLSSRQN